MDKDTVYSFVEGRLEWQDFESLLESFDLTPEEVFYMLWQRGLIDEEIINRERKIR